MTLATGIGSHPGDDQRAYDEALATVLGELPDLPYLPEVPGRGPHATLQGRGVALLAGLGADLQPAGWRLTGGGAAGLDQRRAVSLLAQDLDRLEERTQHYAGPLKVQVPGPWTLAATVERPRGDRVLADHGARRELAEALTEGTAEHLADLRRRVPGAQLLVQVDEPALPAVLSGAVPTASGLSRHRSVDAPSAAGPLEALVAVVRDGGAEPLVHCCADHVPLDLLARVGAPGLAVDADRLDAAGLDGLALAMEAGRRVLLGVVPTLRPPEVPTDAQVTARVARLLDVVGLAPSDRLALTPACGLAAADPTWARTALTLSREAAAALDRG